MGASWWSYFVPYQPDIDKALQELKQKVFQSGEYFKPVEFYGDLFKQINPNVTSEPKTIQELIDFNDDEGTHSIIDMQKVSLERGLLQITSLTHEEYLNIFGTDKPTHQMIEELESDLVNIREPYEGVYILVFKDGYPEELYFAGYSGD